MRKKIIILIIVVTFVLPFNIYALEDDTSNDIAVFTLNGQEAENYAIENNIPLEDNGKKLESLSIQRSIDKITQFMSAEPVSTEPVSSEPISTSSNYVAAGLITTGTYLNNVRIDYPCGSTVIGKESGPGPCTLSCRVSRSLAISVSTDVSVSIEIISAKVGFDVTETETVAGTYSRTVPAGKTGVIQAFPEYRRYRFDIWRSYLVGSDAKVGEGSVLYPFGTVFAYYEY